MIPTIPPVADDEAMRIAALMSDEQRDLLLRYAATADDQPITADVCFGGSPELYVELSPDVYDDELGFVLVPGEKAWLAGMRATSKEGSAKWDECTIHYTDLGLRVRAALQNGGTGGE